MKIIVILLLFISTGCASQTKNKASKAKTSKTTKQTTKVGKVYTGIASYYSKKLHNSKTATGERYRNEKLTGASNNVKLNTWVKVTNLSNNKTVVVRINDRMHPRMAKKGRVVDLSWSAAEKLGFIKKGLQKVKMEVVSAP